MALKDVGNKVPIYKLKTTDEVMKYYDEWGEKDKYNKDMVEWNYTGPQETVDVFRRYTENKEMLIFDAGCGTGLVGEWLKNKKASLVIDGIDISNEMLKVAKKKKVYRALFNEDLTKDGYKFGVHLQQEEAMLGAGSTTRNYQQFFNSYGGDFIIDLILNNNEGLKGSVFGVCLLYTSPSPRDRG